MAIKEDDLSAMNLLLSQGKTIADIAKKYRQYDDWEIYRQVNDYSFLGKKRKISNNLRKLVATAKKEDREVLADDAKRLLDELYGSLKANSKKLISIDRILKKDV